MSTVFVVQEDPRKNLLPALDFGNVEYILDSRDQVTLDPVPWVRRIKTALRRYTENDFILAIGDPAAIGIACAVAAMNTSGRFKMLKWDRQEMRYYPIAVDLARVPVLGTDSTS
jgi:hypothetical protein